MAREYKTKEFPPDDVLERRARRCSMLAYCSEKNYSFCMKRWIEPKEAKDPKGLYFRKITFKHCYECMNDVEY